MTFKEILAGIEPAYPALRKPTGQLYTSDAQRSLKGALSANGLFELVNPIIEQGASRKRKALEKREKVWELKEPEAAEYLKQEMIKFVSDNAFLLGIGPR